jgi:cbb3-type cytochrome c oxidase subunit III
MTARRNKILLLAASLATLAVLLYSAYEENVRREWRQLQRRYRAELPPAQAAAFAVQLRQIYAPGLGAVDRCVSCHVGMDAGETGIEGHKLFAPHPRVVHEPAQYGCVSCHAGQGRATVAADAHGAVAHWPEPMIPVRYAKAGCGGCHTHLEVPNLDRLARGRALFERYDCLACHAMDGRGGTLRPGGAAGVSAPDLSHAGARDPAPRWYESHLAAREAAADGAWRTSFAPIAAADRGDIDVYLRSRVGAPALVEAKALFHSLGCRGCHKIGGVGGDDGPDLTLAGEKDPGRLDFGHVPGERTVAAWHAAHLRAPAAVVPGSLMPELGLTDDQIDSLVLYLLSLRRTDRPEAYWPVDRVRAERLGEREFSTDGATLYGTFCASCHGPNGEGMRYPGMPAFPAIGNPDFLAAASDRFIRANIERGRPGRRMPAWGAQEGGLRPEEIDAVVGHVRSFARDIPPPDDTEPVRWSAGDPALGAQLYAGACASCHGGQGQGGEGPALANRVLLEHATDTYLFENIRRGRRGTSMPAFGSPSPAHRVLADGEIEAIVSFMRTWEDRS